MTHREFFREAALFTSAFWLAAIMFVPGILYGVYCGICTVLREDFP